MLILMIILKTLNKFSPIIIVQKAFFLNSPAGWQKTYIEVMEVVALV
jgi:hypothetical protein